VSRTSIPRYSETETELTRQIEKGQPVADRVRFNCSDPPFKFEAL